MDLSGAHAQKTQGSPRALPSLSRARNRPEFTAQGATSDRVGWPRDAVPAAVPASREPGTGNGDTAAHAPQGGGTDTGTSGAGPTRHRCAAASRPGARAAGNHRREAPPGAGATRTSAETALFQVHLFARPQKLRFPGKRPGARGGPTGKLRPRVASRSTESRHRRGLRAQQMPPSPRSGGDVGQTRSPPAGG